MKRTPIYKALYIQVLGGLVLPAGYSFKLDGTAIYLAPASLFIAQACDIQLSITQTLTMLGVMLHGNPERKP